MVACPLSIATVSCESGASAKLVGASVRLVGGEFGTSAKLVGTSVRLVGLRIWNERGARQNVCETRCGLTLERVRNSLLESFRSRRFPLLAGRDTKSQSGICPLTLNPWLWRANRLNHNGRCSATFAATSECSDESERCTQLVSQQNIAQGLAELPGAITTVLSRSQAPMRRMFVDPEG